MRKHSYRISFVVWALVIFGLGLTCYGQNTAATKDDSQRKLELERKAYAIVEEIATGAHALKLPENRSFVMAFAAGLLWQHDEKRARTLFWDAFNSINLLMVPAGNEEPARHLVSPEDEDRYFAIFTLRQGLLRKVALHDPQLALDMLRSSRQPPSKQVNASIGLPDDNKLEQEIATESANRDPEHALQIARQSLAKGLTLELLELLHHLNTRDPSVAAKFAGDLIDKLQTRNLAADISASRIAVDLVAWSRKPSGKASRNSSLLEDPAATARRNQLRLDDEKRRHLVEMIANAALNGSANSTLLNSLGEIMQEIQEFVPERVALLERKLTAFEQTLNKEQRGWNNYNALVRRGSPEEMIAASLKTDNEQRQMLQQQAIAVAIQRRRADTLREFIKSEVSEQSVLRTLMDRLDSEQVDGATYRGDADELRALLPSLRRAEDRARAMAEIAVVHEKNGDHEEALKLLDEARTLIKVDFESETQTNALFALVAAYALVEPSKAFAIIERTIDRANDQISRALLLDKIVRTGVIKNGEIQLENSSVISSHLMRFRYGKAVLALAKADFNRTKAATDRLERSELRLLARLSMAQALLAKDERRTR